MDHGSFREETVEERPKDDSGGQLAAPGDGGGSGGDALVSCCDPRDPDKEDDSSRAHL